MTKADLIKDLRDKKGVLAKHGTWGLYVLNSDGSVGHCYCGRINPATAERLVKSNPDWLAK